MSWNLYRWVWRLESPLYIGMPPAGVLNRCRLYVPARVMHGAVTAELARIKTSGEITADNYGKMGQETGLNCRFTYLYPAEKINGEYYAWLPRYQKKESDKSSSEEKTGLYWYCQGGEKPVSDREFRNLLLDSRAGTAINPDSDSAQDGTLRETECINPQWRKTDAQQEESKPVYLLGYVFLKENGFFKQLQNIDTLFIGGDTRYGLGKISRAIDWNKSDNVFGENVEFNKEHPEILSKRVFGHVPANDKEANADMFGNKERIGGWDIDKIWEEQYLSWVPGSCADKEMRWMIDTYGSWVTDASLIRKSGRQEQREKFGKSSYKTQHLVGA